MRARMIGAFSPMPPAKTSVSRAPSAAANEPILEAEPIAKVTGHVLLGGLQGARYDVLIAIDTATHPSLLQTQWRSVS